MKRYNPIEIEQKWQDKWDQDGTYSVDFADHSKPKYYAMSMLPGITGAGIHTGHGRTFQFSDIKVRAKRQQGYNAYHPIGWDSFGLPVENYAIKVGKKPREAHDDALINFKRQLKRLGYSYDWSKEISTADPAYYKWTQWIFNQLFQHGLAYQKQSPQWWCETDQTVLANEQVEGGKCWRCGNQVTKKNLKQWFFKITEYADEMLEATDDLDWSPMVKTMQKNWIGRSQGAEVEFEISASNNYVLLHGYDGSPKKDLFPWLSSQLEQKGYKIFAPELPNPLQPDANEQSKYVIDSSSFDENTVLLGHSYGAVTALRMVEQLEKPIKKLVLLAGFCQPGFKNNQQLPFEQTTDWNFDFETIKQNVKEVVILRPSQDSYVPTERADYLQEKLGGVIIDFDAQENHACGNQEPVVLSQIVDTITVFTTRPDTLFGATFVVLAPEHELVKNLIVDETREAVESYVIAASRKSEIERMNESREKTGVFTGSYAINPVNGSKVPIWVADYVLANYGTGAIMAVPAHDERDFAFAEKFNIPVKQVIMPCEADLYNPPKDGLEEVARETIIVHMVDRSTGKYALLDWHGSLNGITTAIMGGIEEGQTAEDAVHAEISEEASLDNVRIVKQLRWVSAALYCASHKNQNRKAIAHVFLAEVDSLDGQREIAADEQKLHTLIWVNKEDVANSLTPVHQKYAWEQLNNETPVSGEGILINSGAFDGMESSEAREEIVAWLEQQGTGRSKTTYKMHDWLISRQRYWGAPIPIIHCDEHGAVAVPDDQLPVILPDIDDFKPKGGVTSALAGVSEWVNTTCPTCGKPAKRETDTLDGYACSSWYFLRYLDPFNDKQAWNPKVEEHWGPVDFYNGADHAVAHLLYSRFWMRFFYKLGLVSTPEPFKRMMYNAYILASDGTKMSKSKGNTIDPLEIMDSGYGADSLRVYEMFIAPYDLEAPWDTRGVPGAYRFLNRAWTLTQGYIDAGEVSLSDAAQKEILVIAHRTAKKVTEDIKDDKFNTAVSSMMEAVNSYYKLKEKYAIGKSDAWKYAIESLLQVLAPFAPHITEELWYQLGYEDTIHVDHWPEWNNDYLQTDTMTIIVQTNGKLRAKLDMPKDTPEEEVKRLALESENVVKFLDNKKPTKVIYVPGRLVNIVA